MNADAPADQTLEFWPPRPPSVRFTSMVALVSLMSVLSSRFDGGPLPIVLLMTATAVPTVELTALRWSSRLPEDEAIRKSLQLVAGLMLFVVVAYAEARASSVEAWVLGGSTAHLYFLSYLWGVTPYRWPSKQRTVVAVTLLTLGAVAIDDGIGVNLVPFAAYGFAVALATIRIANSRSWSAQDE